MQVMCGKKQQNSETSRHLEAEFHVFHTFSFFCAVACSEGYGVLGGVLASKKLLMCALAEIIVLNFWMFWSAILKVGQSNIDSSMIWFVVILSVH